MEPVCLSTCYLRFEYGHGFGTVRAICCYAGAQELEATRVADSCGLDATFVMVS
jgi:hypothetical protein